jgi:hypothetical protein
MPPQSPGRQIARRLIDSRQSQRKAADSGARAAAAACEDLYRELSRWVGPDGCHALFTRALAQAQTQSPTPDQIKLRPRSEPYIDGVAEAIMSRGDAATATALESVLVHVVELLARLTGDDMATKLIELSIAAPDRSSATSDGRREEA